MGDFSLMGDNRVGRYCIKKYDENLVRRMLSLYRHVYSVGICQGKRVIYDFEHNPTPDHIMITDKRIPLTSSYDRMSWDIFEAMPYMVDKTISW